ncbi:hypothetical protein AVEN_157170-1 [Araneus ventricosus]|uniref:Uncharacterized protein n=1 Tax=Araneus ventricosus TaxID=182803 RepID=A0A4Y2IDR1_ARAVE|nr:hypothetical protein AVEN_157170-1 [Araneus ventricosus]
MTRTTFETPKLPRNPNGSKFEPYGYNVFISPPLVAISDGYACSLHLLTHYNGSSPDQFVPKSDIDLHLWCEARVLKFILIAQRFPTCGTRTPGATRNQSS